MKRKLCEPVEPDWKICEITLCKLISGVFYVVFDHCAAWVGCTAEGKGRRWTPKLSSVQYTCASCTLRELKSG